MWELPQNSDSTLAGLVKRRNLWELLLGANINDLLWKLFPRLTPKPYSLTPRTWELPLGAKINERLGDRTPATPTTKTELFWNSLFQKVVSGLTILAFNIVFILPITLLTDLNAQSVPVLGSTKQFASDELKPYVDAAKISATDSGTFMNAVTGGEQVLEAAWEASVNAEIEAIVGGVTNSDAVNDVNVYKNAVRAQLELQNEWCKTNGWRMRRNTSKRNCKCF
ncbi:hypothetical protein [Leptospira alstonii]|nr:hypothetical protein [Leptospira alstonii]